MIAHIGDMQVAYDDTGPADHDTALLFVHGFPHQRAFWAPQLEELGGAWRCVAPDLRGFGETPARSPASMDAYADDLAALLDHLGIRRVAVVGLSMGGYIAFALWRRHRARIAALVLADTRASADKPDARAKRRALIAMANEQGSEAVADAQLPGSLGKSAREHDPELVHAFRDLLAAAPLEGIVGALEAMMARPDSTATLATIDVPTLVVVGRDDVLIRPSDARAMHHRIAGSRFEIIDEAGHASSYERPAEFNRLLRDFLVPLTEPEPTGAAMPATAPTGEAAT